MLKIVWFILILGASFLSGDVKSNSGAILFDRNSNGNAEMRLNQTGLGIGVVPSSNLEVAGNTIINQKLSIGSSVSSQNNLQIHGTYALTPSTPSSGNITLGADSLVLINTSSGDRTVKMPLASTVTGRVYTIKKISSSGNLYLSASGNLIDTEMSLSLEELGSEMASVKLISDGRQWWVLSLSSANLEELASSNLFVEYRLDESSGVVANDESSNNRDGYLRNSHNFSGNSVSAPQLRGLSMDDEEDDLYYNHNTTLVSTAYTWSLWVNSIIDPDDNPTFNSAEVNQEVFGFNWNSGNTLWRKTAFHKLSNDDYVLAQVSSDLAANTWYHVAASWNGSVLKLYLNGSLESSVSATSLKTQDGILKLRNASGVSSPVTKLDHFKLYDKALSAAEIWALYTAGQP